MNAAIRVELLSVRAEIDQEYLRLEAELAPVLTALDSLLKRPIDDFKPICDSETRKAGIEAAAAAILPASWVGILALPIVLIVAVMLFGTTLSSHAGTRSLPYVIVLVFAVLGGIGAYFGVVNTRGREKARNLELAALKQRIEEERTQREQAIASLEARAVALRDEMTRIRLSPKARKMIWERDNKLCYLCGELIDSWDGDHMHVDHLFPWSHGGSNDPDNLRATHIKCNLEKGDHFFNKGGLGTSDGVL